MMKWYKTLCIALLPAAICSGDTISFNNAPTTVTRGQINQITVDYTSSGARDIQLKFANNSPWTVYQTLNASVSGNGSYTFDVNVDASTPLGTDYAYQVKLKDGSSTLGNDWHSGMELVDGASNQAPTISLTSPANNASSTYGDSVTFSATAGDTDGSVAKVEFYAGAAKIGEDITSPYSISYSGLAAGTYTDVHAVATDNDNATTSTANQTFTVNAPANQAPSVSLTAPANNASSTYGDSVTFSATASDTDGSVTKVEFYAGAAKIGEDITSPYAISYNGLAAGTYTDVHAVATDNDNATTSTANQTFTVNAASGGSTNIIYSLSGSTEILQNGSYDVIVDYETTQASDMIIYCKDSQNNNQAWSTFNATANGSRMTETFTLPMYAGKPAVAQNEYTVYVRLVPDGGAWGDVLDDDTIVNLSGVDQLSGGSTDYAYSPGAVSYALNNPLKGIRPNLGAAAEEYASVVYDNIKWIDLEPTIGTSVAAMKSYCDAQWAGLEADGLRVVPRIILEDWGGYYGADGFTQTDYTALNTTFTTRLSDFIDKLGQCWSNDSRVAWVEMGIAGKDGTQTGTPSMSTAVQDLMGAEFAAHLPNKMAVTGNANMFTNNVVGVSWDNWAHDEQMSSTYVNIYNLNNATDRYMDAPIEGKVNYGWGTHPNLGSDNNDTLGTAAKLSYLIDTIRELHCSALGGLEGYTLGNTAIEDGAADVQKALGYRFDILEFMWTKQVNVGDPLNLSFKVKNIGSAPFYYDWPVQVLLLDNTTKAVVYAEELATVDIRNWIPGSGTWDGTAYSTDAVTNEVIASMTTPSLGNGEYILALSIVDPDGASDGSIRFAIENYFNGGIIPIGRVGVGQAVTSGFELTAGEFDDPRAETTPSGSSALAYTYTSDPGSGGLLGITLDSPINGQTYQEGVVAFSSTVENAVGTATVEYWANGTMIGTSSTAPDYRYEHTCSAGEYNTVWAKVTDASGSMNTASRSFTVTAAPVSSGDWFAPCDVEITSNGNTLYILGAKSEQLISYDMPSSTTNWTLNLVKPSGMVLVNDTTLFVTGGGAAGTVWKVVNGSISKQLNNVGHTPMSPVYSDQVPGAVGEERLYVCNRFDNQVAIIDVTSANANMSIVTTMAARREPFAAALSPDGKQLAVANHLPVGKANATTFAAEVSIYYLDNENDIKVNDVQLMNGSGTLNSIIYDPSGTKIYISHMVARFTTPTALLERGWQSNAALSIIDAGTNADTDPATLRATLLLDSFRKGFANPGMLAYTDVGTPLLIVASRGTHQLMLIDYAEMNQRVTDAIADAGGDLTEARWVMHRNLKFLHQATRRVALRNESNGPRAIVAHSYYIYVANYFSDTVDRVNPEKNVFNKDYKYDDYCSLQWSAGVQQIATMSQLRRGELYYNDGTQCFQSWQSCVTCHPEGRADGYNWDLLNDNMGNVKNAKSHLYATLTAPSMWTGVRSNALVATGAGLMHIQLMPETIDSFENVKADLHAYIGSLTPVAGPRGLEADITAGQQVFVNTGCGGCHVGSYFTDQTLYNYNYVSENWDVKKDIETPQLNEVWRTAPYFHDGRYGTLNELVEEHGNTSTLTTEEKRVLVEYLLTL